ncbi:MAG: HDIG domain-containing protein [Chloroflexi bacterium]|nr:HDIG domain-containing protein [Chloroflexota bacterium]
MDRDQALAIVREYVTSDSLLRHMLAVEAALRHYARLFGEDEARWGIIGLLHDFDWEIHPTLEHHPQDGAPLLRARGVPEDVIQSVLSHAEHTGVPRTALRDRALFACDEVTGLIAAVALVRPSRSLADLTPASVRKKWKDRAFAAGVNREDIERGARELGLDVWDHVGHVITAMRGIADQLGLAGNPPSPTSQSSL